MLRSCCQRFNQFCLALCLIDLCLLLELCCKWAAARALVPFQFWQPAPARAVAQFEVESHHLMGSSTGAAIEKIKCIASYHASTPRFIQECRPTLSFELRRHHAL
jgi:hypothetical protein